VDWRPLTPREIVAQLLPVLNTFDQVQASINSATALSKTFKFYMEGQQPPVPRVKEASFKETTDLMRNTMYTTADFLSGHEKETFLKECTEMIASHEIAQRLLETE
jgi:hypothetical protein